MSGGLRAPGSYMSSFHPHGCGCVRDQGWTGDMMDNAVSVHVNQVELTIFHGFHLLHNVFVLELDLVCW